MKKKTVEVKELGDIDVERILKYLEKIQTSEIMYCEDHDREFLKDEECPGCQSERVDREIESYFSSNGNDD